MFFKKKTKRFLFFFCSLFILFLCPIFNFSPGGVYPFIKSKQMMDTLIPNRPLGKPFIVVIDPGHGGKAGGARGRFSNEKDITLAISLKLGELINQFLPEVKVFYTRTQDQFVDFNDRTQLANSQKADLFICIHCNSVPRRAHSPQGAETYVLGLSDENRNLENAIKENADITLENNYKQNYDGFDPNSPESYIMFTLFQNHNQKRSYKLASLIQASLEKGGRINRGVKQEPLIVLRNTAMPGILCETGYISDPEEEIFLNSQEGQALIAKSILEAITQYKADINR